MLASRWDAPVAQDSGEPTPVQRAMGFDAFQGFEAHNFWYRPAFDPGGNALPPPPAIERQMEQRGVSPKQKERARQTFMKSA